MSIQVAPTEKVITLISTNIWTSSLFHFYRMSPNHMMPLVLSPSSVIPSCPINHWKSNSLSNANFTFVHCNILQGIPLLSKNTHPISKNNPRNTSRFTSRQCINSNDELFDEDSSPTYEWSDQEQGETEDIGSPWEGAVVYQRNASISHVEYCTTLERLGLGNFSTKASRSRASVMGLRVTKAVKDFTLGTPVLISVDVSRKKQKLRLDGIIRTVIALFCYRCGEPTSETIFSDFSLLLTEEPVEEPDIIDLGPIFGEDGSGSGEEEEDEDASIDWDDRLYFPPGEKAIDISKNIRDMVHVEITIDAICSLNCKGLCLKCGSNLNNTTCNCSEQGTEKKGYGPLGGLREQMQKT